MTDEPRLSHTDAEGNARMVDVGGKPVTERRAVAITSPFGVFRAITSAAVSGFIRSVMGGRRSSAADMSCSVVGTSGMARRST